MKKHFLLFSLSLLTFLLMATSGAFALSAITGPSTVCAGSTATLSDSTAGGVWTSSSSGVATVGSTGVVTGIAAGTVTITYTIDSISYVIHSMTVNPSPAHITGTTTACIGGSTTLTDGTSGGTWSISPATVASINPTTGVVTGITAGTATLTYSLPTGCFTDVSITVTSSASAGTITGASTVCSGGTASLTDGVSGGTWSSSTIPVATVGSTTGVVTGISAGTTTISYSVTTSCGTAVATHVMTVTTSGTVRAITGSSTVCAGATITLADSTSGGTWYSSDSAVATISSGGVVSGSSAGTTTISYGVTTSCGTVYATATITVDARPTITAGTGSSIAVGGSATLTASGGSTYVWSPAGTLAASTGASVRATPTVTTTYTVVGTSTLGCSNKATETITVTGPCSTPTGLTVSSVTATSAVVHWTAVSGATEYFVAYKKSSAGTWTDLLATGTSVTLTGLTGSTSYKVELRSICGAGDSSGTTPVDSFTTLVSCGTPASLSATSIATTTATVNWAAVSGALDYELAYKAAAASTWTTLYVTGASHTLTGLSAATIYEYEVRSVCGAADSSSYSGYSTFTTLGGLPACPTPTGLTSVLADSIATLSWTAVPGALGYMVTYQLVTRGTPTNRYTTTNSVALTGLTLTSSYEYKVRTVCDPGDTSTASGYTTFRVITAGVAETTNDNNVSIYPNPTQDKFVISYHMDAAQPVTIIVTNAVGQTVGIIANQEQQTEGDHDASFSPMASGLYIVRILIGEHIYTEKVIRY